MEDLAGLQNLLLVDELSELVVPEVERLWVGRSETFYGGHPAQGDTHQLVGDPQGGREVNVELDPLADHRGHVVLTNTQVGAGLEPTNTSITWRC